MTQWQRSSRCESASCPEWRIAADGFLELRDSERPDEVTRFSPNASLTLFDAFRRGEVVPFGVTVIH